MSHSAKIEIGGKQGKTVVLVCDKCSHETVHKIMANVDSDDQTPDGDIQWCDSYLIAQCRGCKTICLCIESSNSEDFDPGDPDSSLVTRTVFPSRIAGRPRLSDPHFLPPRLRKVYEESRMALTQNSSVLTGIGIRAIVETVCNEEGAAGGSLFEKINGLISLNQITRKEAEILQRLRFMGNEAAHNVKQHTQEELNLAFDVVEHLLKTVYILPAQTSHLPSRAGARPDADEDE